ncbi:MAG TPA: ABC transporter transmembrane domain-containing protein [Stellaceae bacterium]|nr:ABC transporter transmembrane domain-containing protein [Stellaceae bacterium]
MQTGGGDLRLERPKGRDLRQLRGLLAFLRPHRWRIAAAGAGLVVATAALIVFGLGLRWLIDGGLSGKSAAGFDRALALLVIVVAVLALATAARSYFINSLGERVAADIRRAVYDHVLGLNAAFFETVRTGELLSRIAADTVLVQTVIGSTTSVALRNLFMLLGGLLMMGSTSLELTGLAAAIVLGIVGPTVLMGRRIRSLSRLSQDRLGEVTAYAQESLAAIQTVQAFGHEPIDRRRFGALVEDAYASAARRIGVRSLFIGGVIFVSFGGLGLILWIGGHYALAGRMTGGELSAFVFYGAMVASSAGTTIEYLSDLQRVAGAIERLTEILALGSGVAVPERPVAMPVPARGAVSFEGVTFHYPSRPGQSALGDFSLSIRQGEKVALVGPSGAGKSTVFQLLLRFHDPQAGLLSFDGVELRKADPAAVRARIGLVPQDPVIFAADAWENIRYGRPEALDEEVEAAALCAGADEFLRRLPQGYSTFLGERGLRLSGGQRQRIAIARAILRNPALLLLDEATNALDAESELHVRTALEQLMEARTTLVIAHRLSTVITCDRIAVMDRGRIVAEGGHNALMARCGLYRRLASLQFSDAEPPAPGAAAHGLLAGD